MNADIITQTAMTAHNQIKAGIGDAAMMSWGILGRGAIEYKGKPALLLTVDARLYQGNVIVALDESSDLYDIYLVGPGGTRLLRSGVYCDELGDTIDREIEVGDDPEAYEAFCEEERKKFIDEYGIDPKGKSLTVIC